MHCFSFNRSTKVQSPKPHMRVIKIISAPPPSVCVHNGRYTPPTPRGFHSRDLLYSDAFLALIATHQPLRFKRAG